MKKRHSLPEILFGDTIVPPCVPFYYRVYLLLCKLSRSLGKLVCHPAAKGIVPDGSNSGKKLILGAGKEPIINKTFADMENDLKNPAVREILQDIDRLKVKLEKEGIKFTTPAGNFKRKDFIPEKEKNKLWENAWILANSKVKKSDVILDIGGASTIFSFLLADMGCRTFVVDNDWGSHGIIYNARFAAKKMNWDMKVLRFDVSKGLPFPTNFFDRVFCICVLEHLTQEARKKVMKEIGRVLKPGGLAAFTFDYDANRDTPGLDRGIRYSFRDRLTYDVIAPSGLRVYGNETLRDDCPDAFFLGSLFMIKATAVQIGLAVIPAQAGIQTEKNA